MVGTKGELMAGLGVTRMTSRHRFVLAACALLAVVALVMIAELNGVLAAMRTDGGVAGSVTDLQVRLVPPRLPTENDVLAIVTSWKAYDLNVVQAAPRAPLRRPDRHGQRRAEAGLVPPRAPLRRLRGAA